MFIFPVSRVVAEAETAIANRRVTSPIALSPRPTHRPNGVGIRNCVITAVEKKLTNHAA